MEITSRPLERENPSPINSPNSNGSSSNSNGVQIQTQTPPLTPKTTISRSESNPYPTTFVQANATTFKHVVQMLTGSSETAKQASKTTPTSDPPPSSSSKNHIPPLKTGQKKQGFKLYERRNQLKNGFMISPLMSSFNQSSSKPEILSPSILNFPALVLSPVTPLIEDPFHKSSPAMVASSSEEEKAIAEKGFYLHPSPRNTDPQLLPLFPVTSPRVSGGSSSSN